MIFNLLEGDSLHLKLSYLGYNQKEQTFTCNDINFDVERISMSNNDLWMNEVVITEKLPAIIRKEDTTIYQVDTFLTGQERKLKEVLNKLPNIHVDNNNEITFNGKKVKEVLVEDEAFFTGDATLAVKYLPANVVDKIEILEKYNEIQILQGQDSGDALALNIRLKKDKTRFVFGDVSVGSNFKKRHLIHGNLFYYSPKTRINTIGNYTTTEEVALTSSELLQFMGFRFDKYNPRSDLIGTNDISQFQNILFPQYYNNRKSIFGINQAKYKFDNGFSIEALLLGTKNTEHSRRKIITTFIDSNAGSKKVEQTTKTITQPKVLNLNISSNPKKKYVLTYDSHYKLFHNNQNDTLQTNFLGLSNALQNELSQTNKELSHEGHWIHEWRKGLQSIVRLRYDKSISKNEHQWLIEGQQIPSIYQIDTTYSNLIQKQNYSINNYNFLGRLNYQISDKTRMFIYVNNDIKNISSQTTSQINEKNLSSLGFGYGVPYYTNQWTFGSRYLWKHNDLKLKLGLDYLKGGWTDLNNLDILQKTTKLVPSINISTFAQKLGDISISYDYKLGLPNTKESLVGIIIRDFNEFETGNGNLRPSLTHRLTFTLLRGKQIKGLQYNANLAYTFTRNPILGGFNLIENSLVWTYQNSQKSLNQWFFLFRFQKFNKQLKLITTTRSIYTRYYQPINNISILVDQYSNYINFYASKNSKHHEWNLQIEFGLRGTPTDMTTQWFWDNSIMAEYRYFINDFLQFRLKSDIRQVFSSTTNQILVNIITDLSYITKDEKYTFKILAYNLLNQKLSAENSFNAFSNISANHELMPRYIQGQVIMLF